MSTEILKREPAITAMLSESNVKSLANTLHLSQKQLEKANAGAIQLASNTNLARCTPISIIQYCYSIARYNFTRDDAVYPIAYGDKIQAQIGFQGWKELAMRTGKYSKIDCVEVKECDEIITDEDGEPCVKFNKDYLKRMDMKRIGFFGYAKDKNNQYVKRIFWTDAMAMKHGRRYSKTFNSLWGNPEDFPKMAKKTIIKFVCKDLDLTEDMQNALREDQAVYQNNFVNGKINYTYEDNPNNIETIDVSSIETPKVAPKVVEAPKPKPVKATPKVETPKVEETPNEEAFDMSGIEIETPKVVETPKVEEKPKVVETPKVEEKTTPKVESAAEKIARIRAMLDKNKK